MIKIKFFESRHQLVGFEASGHSMHAPQGEDIVCAAVSSACLMAANTLTEVVGLSADIKAEDGYLRFVLDESIGSAKDIFDGLKLHLEAMSQSYPNNIEVTISEV